MVHLCHLGNLAGPPAGLQCSRLVLVVVLTVVLLRAPDLPRQTLVTLVAPVQETLTAPVPPLILLPLVENTAVTALVLPAFIYCGFDGSWQYIVPVLPLLWLMPLALVLSAIVLS